MCQTILVPFCHGSVVCDIVMAVCNMYGSGICHCFLVHDIMAVQCAIVCVCVTLSHRGLSQLYRCSLLPYHVSFVSCEVCHPSFSSFHDQWIKLLHRIYFIRGDYGMTLLCFSSTKMNDNCVFLSSIQQSRVVLTGKSNIFEILSMRLFQTVAVQHSLGRKWVHHAGWDRLMKRVSTRLKRIAPVWEYTYLH